MRRIAGSGSLACALALQLTACGGQGDPIDEVRALHAEGRYAATVDRLRRLVDQDPERIEAQLLLGEALLRTGRSGLAVWPLRKAAESPEHAVEAGLLLTQALLQGRSAPDAVRAASRVLELEPDNVNARVLRVNAYQATGQLEEALADIERVLELDPENLAVLAPRVAALIALQRIEEAEAALAAAREALETTDQPVPAQTESRLCVAQAMFAFEKGEQEAAGEQYAHCLEQFPLDPLTVRESAGFYDAIGESERATELLEEAYAQSGNGYFRLALAARMGALGQAEEQLQLLRDEAEERPSVASWFAVADYHVNRDEFEPALAAFEKALAATPEPPPMLRFAYVDTLVQAERFEEAREAALEIEQMELRDLIEGRIRLAQGDPAGALAAFEAGIRLWPNNAAARFLAGQAAEQIGDFERAVSEYRESVRATPGQTEAGLALAQLYRARGQYDDGLEATRRYLLSHPTSVEGHLVRARIAYAMGRNDVAGDTIQRLWRLPGSAALAVAEEARLLASDRGPELGKEAVERSKLDLTDPQNAEALRALLEQHAALAEHAAALERVAAAIAAQPEEAVFHALRADALRAAGEPAARARAAYERALELDPAHTAALVGLAELAAEAGDVAGAVALYDRAAASGPASVAASLAAARLLREQGRTQQAETRLRAIVGEHPREAAAAHDLALLLAERGDLAGARDFAERAAWFRLPEAEATLERIEALDRAQATASRPAADPADP